MDGWGVKKDGYAALPILAMMVEPENLEFLFFYSESCKFVALALHLPLNNDSLGYYAAF